jgi:hypothetical protein
MQKYFNLTVVFAAFIQMALCFYGVWLYGQVPGPIGNALVWTGFFSFSKLFVAGIGWYGLKLRLDEERMFEGFVQLSVYSVVMIVIVLAQLAIILSILIFLGDPVPIVEGTGPTDIALAEFNNFAKCKYNDCCYKFVYAVEWDRQNKIRSAGQNATGRRALFDRGSSGSQGTSGPDEYSQYGPGRLLVSNVSSEAHKFFPEICFKNPKNKFPALGTGERFCGDGHYCEVAVNASANVTALAPGTIQIGRRRLLSAPSPSPSPNASTYSPSPSPAPAPSPSEEGEEEEDFPSLKENEFDPICDDIFADVISLKNCKNYEEFYEAFIKSFREKMEKVIYLISGICFIELVCLTNSMMANCWFCGPRVKVDIDEEFTDSESSSSDEELEDGSIVHHSHHRHHKKRGIFGGFNKILPGGEPSTKIKKKKKSRFHHVGTV